MFGVGTLTSFLERQAPIDRATKHDSSRTDELKQSGDGKTYRPYRVHPSFTLSLFRPLRLRDRDGGRCNH